MAAAADRQSPILPITARLQKLRWPVLQMLMQLWRQHVPRHNSRVLSSMRPVELGRMVRAIGDHLLSRKNEIATVLCLEAGKPHWEAIIEVEGAARYFEYYGNQAETMEGRSIPLGADYLDFTIYEPVGVSAQIIRGTFRSKWLPAALPLRWRRAIPVS